MMRIKWPICKWKSLRYGPLAVTLVVGIVNVTGCSSSDAKSTAEKVDRSQPQLPGDPGIVPKAEVPDEFAPLGDDSRPVTFGERTYENGSPTHYADGSPVFMPDGSPIDYRPRNVMRQLRRVPVAYVRESTGELVMLTGAKSSPAIDPATGDVCWRAFECVNPNCPNRPADGGPSLYGEKPDGVGLSDDGTTLRRTGPEIDGFRSDLCPFCGSDGGEEYQPKALAEERASLMMELQQLNTPPARK